MTDKPLDYTLMNDTLFKMLFVRYPDLLKLLTADILNVSCESIEQFEVMNPELPPDSINEKFCRLDINMTVNGQRVDIEIQVNNEGDYPERSLYYWAREYSSALLEGTNYSDLPRVIIVSILSFRLFKCSDFHSEFRAIEANCGEQLTDRMSLHYFELPKLPGEISSNDRLRLWLALFNAKTEADIARIESLGVPEMNQAINAYRSVSVADEFKEAERLRFLASCNEASALNHARRQATQEADAKWQAVVADKDAKWQEAVAYRDAEITLLRSRLASKPPESV